MPKLPTQSTLDFKLACINTVRSQQHGGGSEDYVGGFADALSQCVEAIEKLPLPDMLSPRDAYPTPKPL